MKIAFVILISLFHFQTVLAQNIDIELLQSINKSNSTFQDDVFNVTSHSVLPLILTMPMAVATTGLIKKDKLLLQSSIYIATSSILTYGLTTSLKYGIHRQRPYTTYDFIDRKDTDNTPSFPSGHTSAAFSLATSLSISFPKWYVILPSYTWASLVAYGRMYQGMHYPTDVLGGIALGIGSSYLSYKINRWLVTRYEKKKQKPETEF